LDGSSSGIAETPECCTLGCAEVFRIMAFAQPTWRESLRDIETCMAANQDIDWDDDKREVKSGRSLFAVLSTMASEAREPPAVIILTFSP